MAKLFQAQKVYGDIPVTDVATAQEVITPVIHYKAISKVGSDDVIIKWGDSTVVASAVITGNVYDDEGIDILTGGSIQTLQIPNGATHFSVICKSGETADLQIVVGAGV